MPRTEIGLLRVGDIWGDGAGDTSVRVHRVDPFGGRAQLRMANSPGPGKVWDVRRRLKPGMRIWLRRWRDADGRVSDDPADRVCVQCTVLSAQQNGVTVGVLRLDAWDAPEVQAREVREALEAGG